MRALHYSKTANGSLMSHCVEEEKTQRRKLIQGILTKKDLDKFSSIEKKEKFNRSDLQPR